MSWKTTTLHLMKVNVFAVYRIVRSFSGKQFIINGQKSKHCLLIKISYQYFKRRFFMSKNKSISCIF